MLLEWITNTLWHSLRRRIRGLKGRKLQQPAKPKDKRLVLAIRASSQFNRKFQNLKWAFVRVFTAVMRALIITFVWHVVICGNSQKINFSVSIALKIAGTKAIISSNFTAGKDANAHTQETVVQR